MRRLGEWLGKYTKDIIIVLITAVVSIAGTLGVTLVFRTVPPSFKQALNSKTGLSLQNISGNTKGELSSRIPAKDGDKILFCVEFYNSSKGTKAKDIDVTVSLQTNKSNEMEFSSTVYTLTAKPLIGNAIVETDSHGSWISFDKTAKWYLNGKCDDINVEQTGNSISINVSEMDYGIDNGGRAEFTGKISSTPKAQVTGSSVSDGTFIQAKVSTNGSDWRKIVEARPAEVIYLQIIVRNDGPSTVVGLMVKDNLPTRVTYITGSTYLFNGSYMNGININDNLVLGGINIGNYAQGASATVLFKLKLDSSFTHGLTTMTNVAGAKSNRGSVVFNECQVLVGL